MSTLASRESRLEVKHESFEDTYKKAYSHGLESIYALQTVDPKSIRPMSVAPIVPVEIVEKKDSEKGKLQTEMDFGGHYQNWIKPFFLQEPIQVLGLSILAEKTLLSNDKKVVADLLAIQPEDLVHLKGMGQGHLDEIKRALDTYVAGRDLNKAYSIDFLGWIRCFIGGEDRKKAKVAIEPYGLDSSITLTHSEDMEVKRLTLEARREWIEEVYQKISSESTTRTVQENFKVLIDVFIKPWMWGRNGIAAEYELIERFECVAEKDNTAVPALQFIQSVYFTEKSPFDQFLIRVDNGLYCADKFAAERYQAIIQKATSYFYIQNACYTLDELTTLLLREYAAEWKEISQEFIEKTLRFSPQFCVHKAESGKLIIYRT